MASFYQEYGELLDQYVLEDGRVDYDSLRRKRLWIKQLLRTPDELDPNVYRAWSESERLAFWINTYNLKMLDVIVRNHPIESSWWLRLTWPPSDIRHIEGIWSDYRFIGTDKRFKDRPPETRAVLNFLTRYLGEDDVHFLEVENYANEYTNFDWRLNDASRRP